MTSLYNPIPRVGAYEFYWKFASERQKIFERRLKGLPPPWTNDPILSTYKFCNVYRATDRVSQFMIKDVCYNPEHSEPEDRLFQIVAFRFFSNIDTWLELTKHLGKVPTISDLADGRFEEVLNHTKEIKGKLYTNAFILCANDAYGRRVKHLNHVELFKDMFISRGLAEKILSARSLEEVYNLLHEFPLMGDFMSYQTAIDLNYSEYVNFSENEFTKAGPGALRGIKKVFESTNGMTPEQVVMWMVENQDKEFARLGYVFKGLFGRRLTAIDCQGLFCETDKYCREAIPDLASARVRIKTKYSDHQKKVTVFLPPKWQLQENK